MPVADASLKLIADWTVPHILATLARRTEAIAARARAEFGIDSVPSDRRAGHYLGLRFRDRVLADLPVRLAAERVYVSVRAAAMRVTPHLWTTDTDVERLFAVLGAAVA
jgi:selenocysteine lyase/cysteine desulfurase